MHFFLKGHDEKQNSKKPGFIQKFFNGFNRGFKATVNRYGRSVHFLYRHKWITGIILLLAVLGIWWSSATLKTGFVPDEDRGIIFMNVELPAGSSIDRTHEVNQILYSKIKNLPGVPGGIGN